MRTAGYGDPKYKMKEGRTELLVQHGDAFVGDCKRDRRFHRRKRKAKVLNHPQLGVRQRQQMDERKKQEMLEMSRSAAPLYGIRVLPFTISYISDSCVPHGLTSLSRAYVVHSSKQVLFRQRISPTFQHLRHALEVATGHSHPIQGSQCRLRHHWVRGCSLPNVRTARHVAERTGARKGDAPGIQSKASRKVGANKLPSVRR